MEGRFDALTELEKPPQKEVPASVEKKAALARSSPPPQVSQPEKKGASGHGIATPRHRDTATPSMTPIHHDANQESEEEYIEVIRKAVKQVGKEGGTYRFTLDEKTAMKQIRRHYEDQGINTSDIEITRIGLNYILEDFRKHGEESLLAKVMKRLKE